MHSCRLRIAAMERGPAGAAGAAGATVGAGDGAAGASDFLPAPCETSPTASGTLTALTERVGAGGGVSTSIGAASFVSCLGFSCGFCSGGGGGFLISSGGSPSSGGNSTGTALRILAFLTSSQCLSKSIDAKPAIIAISIQTAQKKAFFKEKGGFPRVSVLAQSVPLTLTAATISTPACALIYVTIIARQRGL